MLTIDVIMLLNNVYSACAVHFYLRVFSTAVLFVYLLVLWVITVQGVCEKKRPKTQ